MNSSKTGVSLQANTVVTPNLELVPIGPENAEDYWLVHNDDSVVPWYDGWRPSMEEAKERAAQIDESWCNHGVHKWIAYDRKSKAVIGRGGLSRTPINDDWGQIYQFLPDALWARTPHANDLPFRAHASWVEMGWALRRAYWGRGLATEIGRASLAFGFETLGLMSIVSCTARHNERSRAVMVKVGLRYVGEIYSRGVKQGEDRMSDDAPFSTFLITDGEFFGSGSGYGYGYGRSIP